MLDNKVINYVNDTPTIWNAKKYLTMSFQLCEVLLDFLFALAAIKNP